MQRSIQSETSVMSNRAFPTAIADAANGWANQEAFGDVLTRLFYPMIHDISRWRGIVIAEEPWSRTSPILDPPKVAFHVNRLGRWVSGFDILADLTAVGESWVLMLRARTSRTSIFRIIWPNGRQSQQLDWSSFLINRLETLPYSTIYRMYSSCLRQSKEDLAKPCPSCRISIWD